MLDGVERGSEATVGGLVFGINGAVGLGSHLFTPTIIDDFGGFGSVYIFVGALTALAGVIVVFTPFPRYDRGEG